MYEVRCKVSEVTIIDWVKVRKERWNISNFLKVNSNSKGNEEVGSMNYFLIIELVLKTILVVVPILLSVAFFTLVERKILSAMQRRKGPNIVGFFGLLQPFADALKLLVKETLYPSKANQRLFVFAPILSFGLSIASWGVIPFDFGYVIGDINLGVLYIFAMSSLGVYAIIIAGWSSNSRYSFLGGLRSSAQMISYEISIGLILINVLLCVGSLNLTEIVVFQEGIWFIVPLFPLFLMFLISTLAETSRAPFDLPEAEGELVAGYFVEYGSVGFALFFIAEYANIILMSSLSVIFFIGGWYAPFNLDFSLPGIVWFVAKTLFFMFVFVWVRAALPRYRYDQLMQLGWKVFLPLSIGWMVFTSSIIFAVML